jgi:hypothetical protein
LAGLRRAKAWGTQKTGKPCGRPKIEATMEAAIKAALAKGEKGMHKIAIEFGAATGALQRIKAAPSARKH